MNNSPYTTDGPLLTVAMIVRDAAALLPATLDNLRSIADRFVILDTGSCDATVRIAREAGAEVFETEWCDDFAAARNECSRHLGGRWTLWIDAGETLDELAAVQLRHYVEQEASTSKAYVLYVQKPVAGGEPSAEQIGQLRLLPTQARLEFRGRVRESPLESALEAGLEVDALDCRIMRPPCEAEPAVRSAKAERHLFLAELAIAAKGPTPVLLNVRAQSLAELGRGDEAASVYRQAIGASERGSTEMLEAYYGLLSHLDTQPDCRELQMTTCLEALEIYPLDAQLLCGMGCYLLQQQRLDLAARSYELAATHGQIDPGTWHLADLADVAITCQSLALQLLGDTDKAQHVLQTALEERVESVRIRRQLIDLWIKSQALDQALAELDQLLDIVPHGEPLVEAVRCAVLVAGGKPAEGLPGLMAIYEAGCRDPLCLRWLTTALLQLNQWETAECLLDQWQLHEPHSSEIASCRLALLGIRQRPDRDSQPPLGGLNPRIQRCDERTSPARPRYESLLATQTHAALPPANAPAPG